MAVYFETSDPAGLLRKFEAAVEKGAGKDSITTWVSVKGDFTHAAVQWNKKAYFEPHVDEKRLRFNIVKTVGANILVTVYGFYHGHLVETFLNHFDGDFDRAIATSLPSTGDRVK
jgi:hypothetical protein